MQTYILIYVAPFVRPRSRHTFYVSNFLCIIMCTAWLYLRWSGRNM